MELDDCVSAIDSNGRAIRIADAHRSDGKRFVVHADERLTAFTELESAILPVASRSVRKVEASPAIPVPGLVEA